MASMRDIKRRKSSVQSTQQITKAMKLVSTVKLQRAKGRAEKSKTYFNCMYDTVVSMLSKAGDINHPYLKPSASARKAVIVITANRGLAGGYNSNIVKLVRDNDWNKEDLIIYPVGSKGRDAFARMGYELGEDYSAAIEEPIYADAMKISNQVLEDFATGRVGEIYVVYTGFKNTVTHIPTLLKLLPVKIEDKRSEEDKAVLDFEPETEDAVDLIIPKYITSLIYGAMIESVASENGARMQAMDSATSNADEMIGKLSLLYNRARQSSITQELTEIIAGAEAIS
ncbi:MAG: ATP synthase F1 subunit gamma [Lachnospiraceae bacterium]|nr:ATP synthase F1 subunit gamma [Lachnospiraceae bacterium]